MRKIKFNFSFLENLPKQYRRIVGGTIAFTGLNFLGVISVIGVVSGRKDIFDKYYEKIFIALIVMFILMVLSLLVISISLCKFILHGNFFLETFNDKMDDFQSLCSNIDSKTVQWEMSFNKLIDNNKNLENNVLSFSQNLESLYKLVAQMEIAGNIINKNKLLDIEKKVPSNKEIIIFSSKYRLDEEFKPVIISNIERGITYKYIVAGADESSRSHKRFTQIVESWYNYYIESSHHKRKSKMKVPINKSKINQRSKKDPAQNDDQDFYNHVKEYCSPFSYDLMTIMLYQKNSSKNNYNYHVIVNLPIEGDGYYSYILPESSKEKECIIDSIVGMCSDKREYKYHRGER